MKVTSSLLLFQVLQWGGIVATVHFYLYLFNIGGRQQESHEVKSRFSSFLIRRSLYTVHNEFKSLCLLYETVANEVGRLCYAGDKSTALPRCPWPHRPWNRSNGRIRDLRHDWICHSQPSRSPSLSSLQYKSCVCVFIYLWDISWRKQGHTEGGGGHTEVIHTKGGRATLRWAILKEVGPYWDGPYWRRPGHAEGGGEILIRALVLQCRVFDSSPPLRWLIWSIQISSLWEAEALMKVVSWQI